MSEQLVRFVQISDTHVFSDKEGSLLGVKTHESLQAVVTLLAQYRHEYDFIIHSGDLSQDYSAESYQVIIDCLDVLEKPIYFVPGNHDFPAVMDTIFPRGNWLLDKQLVFQDWQLILLNSQKLKAVEGYLSDEQCLYLKDCLAQYPEKYASIVLHHHPVPVGAAWLDRLGLENADAFWQVVRQFPNVKLVFFGHVHQAYAGMKDGVQCYAVPSTCIQFMRNQDAFGLEQLPPGFRLTTLHSTGQVSTSVIRLDQYVGRFEANATGY